MNKFKIRPVQLRDEYYVEFSTGGIGFLRQWEDLSVWDSKLQMWVTRKFSQKRAEQVCRQLKSLRDVLNFQAETYR